MIICEQEHKITIQGVQIEIYTHTKNNLKK